MQQGFVYFMQKCIKIQGYSVEMCRKSVYDGEGYFSERAGG